MLYQDYLKQAKTVKMSAHYTLYDVCYSQTAVNKGLDNTPQPQDIINARLVVNNILEACCNHFKTRPDVNRIFSTLEVNKELGGAQNPVSQHCYGQAVDFVIVDVPLIIIIDFIRNNLNFDQLILESTWIHCSYKNSGNRKQVLKNVNGKYIAI